MKHNPSIIARLTGGLLVLGAVLFGTGEAKADKIRDLCDVVGVRDNQLIGYGVVTGLQGTGDDVTAPFAQGSLLALMRRLGVQIDSKQIRLRNVAAVLVTATLPPFAKPGSKLDVTVSSIGNATSLRGGILLQSLLNGADSNVYAVAQGPLVIGGFSAKGSSGSSVQASATNTGRVPGGALVEREVPTSFIKNDAFTLSLKEADFRTSSKLAAAIDKEFGSGTATAQDGANVLVKIPSAQKTKPIDFLAKISDIDVVPASIARVIVNERTGTIVAGGDVHLTPVAISHGGITIVIKEQPAVSQPGPLARGTTTTVPQSSIETSEKTPAMTYLKGAASLADVAQAFTSLGVTPRELASILQALRQAGALRAEIIIQ